MESRIVDRVVGISLGIVLGLAIVVVFVFLGSEGTIDAPRVSGANGGAQPPGLAPPARTRTPASPGP